MEILGFLTTALFRGTSQGTKPYKAGPCWHTGATDVHPDKSMCAKIARLVLKFAQLFLVNERITRWNDIRSETGNNIFPASL
jgi:hypothetical protein